MTKKLTQAELEQRRQHAAPAGGRAVVRKYGPEYMAELGRKGAQAQHNKYAMVPVGPNNFAYVDRETGQVIATQFPLQNPSSENQNTLQKGE